MFALHDLPCLAFWTAAHGAGRAVPVDHHQIASHLCCRSRLVWCEACVGDYSAPRLHALCKGERRVGHELLVAPTSGIYSLESPKGCKQRVSSAYCRVIFHEFKASPRPLLTWYNRCVWSQPLLLQPSIKTQTARQIELQNRSDTSRADVFANNVISHAPTIDSSLSSF